MWQPLISVWRVRAVNKDYPITNSEGETAQLVTVNWSQTSSKITVSLKLCSMLYFQQSGNNLEQKKMAEMIKYYADY